MSCNCKGNTYNIGMGCCQPVLAPIENYYTKWQVDDLIESATTSGCCITPEEVDEKIDEAVSGYATEQWVEDKHYLTEHQPLKTINGQVISGSGNIEIECESGITSGEVQTMIDNSISGKQDTLIAGDNIIISGNVISSSGCDLSDYYTKEQVDAKIPSLSGYATEQWVEDKHYITGVDLSNYATKSEIPVIPTSNTAFTNDAGYLTEHQSLTAYSTTNEVSTLINQAVSGKQDTLSAGTNITIVDNVISATNGGSPAYSASSGINISNNEISTKVGNGLRYTQDGTLEVNSTNVIASGNTQVPLSYVVYSYVNNNCMMKSQIWCGTQAEYDAITTKDNNVIYLIYD